MNTTLKLFTYLSAILGALLFLRPKDAALNTLLWIPKMISGALSPFLGIIGLVGALLGFFRRDWKLTGVGLLGAGLAARFITEIPTSGQQFSETFGTDWQARIKPELRGLAVVGRRSSLQREISFQRDVVIGKKPSSGKPYRVDLWQPRSGEPRSGLGVIYAHGGGWRIGDKDMQTRPFFRRLAAGGHVVVDIAYTFWPEADIPTMVSEVNQAVLWMKDNNASFGLNPERIVLMGGSTGAHLALLAAYNPGKPEFQPTLLKGDTSVRGVVAFYPMVDLFSLYFQILQDTPVPPRPIDNFANAYFNRLFDVPQKPPAEDNSWGQDNYLVDILGGTPEEIPQVYHLCSPIEHINAGCPPTLLIQDSDDVFGQTPYVRRFHQALRKAGVPVIYLEYPHTGHGFDLILPQISPVAQAATREVERFLALLQ